MTATISSHAPYQHQHIQHQHQHIQHQHQPHPIFCDLTIMFKPAVPPKEADRQAGVECEL